jgi:hypothetical protein
MKKPSLPPGTRIGLTLVSLILASSVFVLAQGSEDPCPFSAGFWKNHPNDWPVNQVVLGDQTYSKSEAIDVLNLPTSGDASLALGRQLIAAKLNIAIGSDPVPIATQLTQANILLTGYGHKLPYGVPQSSTNGQAMVSVASTLNSYNNNQMTPGCTQPPTPLPIQLASFTGTAVNSSTVLLHWTTLSELNNYGFFVQRRQAQAQEYTEIPNSFVPGHGTTIEPQHYSFTDNSATVTSWYYRLRQIDLDGSEHFSDAIRVDVVTGVAEEIPRVFTLAQNYPNPFNPTTTISYQLASDSFVRLKVFDALGREIALLVNDKQSAGTHEVKFDASGSSSGVYFYSLSAGSFHNVKSMLLLK